MLSTALADEVAERTPFVNGPFSVNSGRLDTEVSAAAAWAAGNFAVVFRTERAR